jgi:integrase/recombinase XerD
MPNYKGKTKGTRRIIIWRKNKPHERVIQGTKREADEYEARWRLELEGTDPIDPLRVPRFSDFCVSHYRPHAERHLKASTWASTQIYQVDTLARHFGSLRLSEFSLSSVEQFKTARHEEKLVKRHGQLRPVTDSTINAELRLLRTILNFAKSMGYPVAEVKWKRLKVRGNPRAQAWTEDEVQRLFEAAQKLQRWLVPVFVFLLNTGCRKGEAIVAEHSWLDWKAMMLRIPSNEWWQPKNGLPREVPISDAVRAALCSGRSPAADGAVPGAGKYLFTCRYGTRYLQFPARIFDKIRKEAGVTGGPHKFRHTFASHFLKNQPDLFLLAQVMGHSHSRVTELYSHMLPDHLARARNAVNIGPALKPVEVKKEA